jgi:secreted PhoX family phosphatase
MSNGSKFPKKIDLDDIGYNTSDNPSFNSVLETRLSRRGFVLGGVSSGALALFGGVSLSTLAGCNSDDDGGSSTATPTEKLLGFTAIAKSLADMVTLPAGYSYSVLCALGDPLTATTPAYKNDGSDTDFDNRFGDHHDGMEYFGLDASGKPSTTSTDRALIAMNHEATTDETLSSFFVHTNGGTKTLPRPASEVDKEVPLHGISVAEVSKASGAFKYVQKLQFQSPYYASDRG